MYYGKKREVYYNNTIMQSDQGRWIKNKIISNYKWLLEEITNELVELENTQSLEEKERIMKKTEWKISEFLKSNNHNLQDLKKMYTKSCEK